MRPINLNILLCVLLAGCNVGKDYVRPSIEMPEAFKETEGWKIAQPRDSQLSSHWWEMFEDVRLNALEAQVEQANQSVSQAQAQYQKAQHLVQSAQAGYLPILNLTGTTNRFQAASGQNVAVSGVRNLFGSALSVAWEPDVWGSVSREVESATSNAQASAATLQGITLSAQATLAQNYFQLNILDELKKLFDETLRSYEKTVTIIKNRYAVGMVAKSEVMQAQTQLETVRAQSINLGVQRAKLEHAIAVLIGKTPAELTLTPETLKVTLPEIPISIPSDLLERRPDIASAERKMAAANAQIGIAKAAYYPTLNLASTSGYQSNDLNSLFNVAKQYWALGPASLALAIFDGGTKNAQYKQTLDEFDSSVAAYRQTVLSSFQEVEDNLAALRILSQQILAQQKAVESANLTLTLTLNQYSAGTISFLNVLTAQTTALSNQQTAMQLQGERLLACVQLIKALGGGWHDTQLPTVEESGGERHWTDFLNFPMN
jgi:NodT family efflux transporter outer membrane factor (OMF) lipoprotein